MLPGALTVANIRAIVASRTSEAQPSADEPGGVVELQVEWEADEGGGAEGEAEGGGGGGGGAPKKVWLPRSVLMADGVTAGMVLEFEDNLLEVSAAQTEEATAVFASCLPAGAAERAAREGGEKRVRVRDLAHALEAMGVAYASSLPLPPPLLPSPPPSVSVTVCVRRGQGGRSGAPAVPAGHEQGRHGDGGRVLPRVQALEARRPDDLQGPGGRAASRAAGGR